MEYMLVISGLPGRAFGRVEFHRCSMEALGVLYILARQLYSYFTALILLLP